MRNDTYIDISRYDEKESFHLVYAAYNEDQNKTMHDEIRKINDALYLGLGGTAWSLNTVYPGPFALYGTPGPWVGPDESE